MATINTILPDLCLRTIFDRLPLTDLLLNLPAVCPYWSTLVPTVLANCRTLVLLIGTNPHALPASNPLQIVHQDKLLDAHGKPEYPVPPAGPIYSRLEVTQPQDLAKITKTIMSSALSNLTTLEIFVNNVPIDAIDHLVALIYHFSSSLTTLKLHLDFNYDEFDLLLARKVYFTPLKLAINGLPLLNSLTMVVFDDFCVGEAEFLHDLSVLERLSEFNFYSFELGTVLLEPLKRFGMQNDQEVKKIAIGNVFTNGSRFLENFKENPNLLQYITALPNATFLSDHLPLYNRTFTSLTTLWLNLESYTLSSLTATLAPLTSLLHLNLTIDFTPLSRFDDDDEESSIQALPSIQILVLIVSTRTHTYLESPHWGAIFPRLQIIQLYHFGAPCTVCNQLGVQHPLVPIEAEERQRCLKMLIRPLKQCRMLRKLEVVDYYPNNDQGERWSFNPEDL